MSYKVNPLQELNSFLYTGEVDSKSSNPDGRDRRRHAAPRELQKRPDVGQRMQHGGAYSVVLQTISLDNPTPLASLYSFAISVGCVPSIANKFDEGSLNKNRHSRHSLHDDVHPIGHGGHSNVKAGSGHPSL